jgi:hypothetical protein
MACLCFQHPTFILSRTVAEEMDAVALWPAPRPAGQAPFTASCAITARTDNITHTTRIDLKRSVFVKFYHVAGFVYEIGISDCLDKANQEAVFPYPSSFQLLPVALRGDNRSLIVANSIQDESTAAALLLINFDLHLSKTPLRLPGAIVTDRSYDNTGIVRYMGGMGGGQGGQGGTVNTEEVNTAAPPPPMPSSDTRLAHHFLILFLLLLLMNKRIRSVSSKGACVCASAICWVGAFCADVLQYVLEPYVSYVASLLESRAKEGLREGLQCIQTYRHRTWK